MAKVLLNTSIKITQTDAIEPPIKVSVKYDENIKKALFLNMKKNKYKRNQKSKWLIDAITNLLNNDYCSSILLSTTSLLTHDKKNKLEQFLVPKELWIEIFKACHETSLAGAKDFPPVFINISLSDFIRSAIINKLE